MMPRCMPLLILLMCTFLGMSHGVAQIVLERKAFSNFCLTSDASGPYFSTTVGESVIGTFLGGSLNFTQGFQQPELLTPLAVVSVNLHAHAVGRQVQLHWEVPEGVAEGVFLLERRLEAMGEFAVLHQQPATGKQSYQQVDADPALHARDRVAYRLWHRMPNGAEAWSETVEVTFEGVASIRLFPNPATGEVHLSGLPAAATTARLVNALGQVWERPLQEQSGIYTLSLTGLAQGIYTLTLGAPQPVPLTLWVR